MKQLKLLFTVLFLAVLGLGNVWAESPETISLADGSFDTDHITWDGTSCTVTQSKGSSSTAVSSSYVSAPRVYKGHVLAFEAKTGYKITQIDIKVSGTYYGNSMTAGIAMSGTSVTDNTTAVDRTWASTSGGTHVISSADEAGLDVIYIQNVASTNTQLRFTEIKVYYTTSGDPDPEPTKYTVTVADGIANGTVTASPTSAKEGDVVTLTATPSTDYEFGEWNVTNASTSAAITVTDNKFQMPAANVNVSATFNEIQGGGDSNEKTYNFADMTDFSTWGTSYEKKTTTFSDGAYAELASANKSTSNVTDCPVTKGGDVIFKAPEGKKIASLTFTCTQWTTKAQTITLNTSANGTDYTATSTTSSNFVLSASNLSNVRAVKFTFSSTSNQVGVKSIKVTYIDDDDPVLESIAVKTAPTTITYTEGQKFDPAGLVITKNMSAGDPEDVEYAGHESAFTFVPALTADLATTDTKVTITYGGKSVDQAITVGAFAPTAGTYNIIPNNAFWGNEQNGSVAVSKNTAFGPKEEKGISVSMNSGNSTNSYINGTSTRVYSGYTVTIAAPDGFELTAIDFTGSTWVAPTASVGTMDSKSWTGNASEVTFTFTGTSYMTNIAVTYAVPATLQSVTVSGAPSKVEYVAGENFDPAGLTVTGNYSDESHRPITEGITWSTPAALTAGQTSVSITATVAGVTSAAYEVTDLTVNAAKNLDHITLNTDDVTKVFWKGETFNYTNLVVTAHYDDETHTDVTPLSVSTPNMTLFNEAQTITVSYKEGGVTKEATYEIEVKTIANTQETAYTTTEAIALIDAGKDLLTEVYVKGKVSQVDSYNSTYKSITYWLDDNAFEVYSGKNLNNTEFSAKEDLAEGDEVIIYGVIKKYNSTYEFDKNNYIVAFNRPVVLTSIELNTDDVKKTYKIGTDDVFSAEGLVVTAHYNVSSNDKTIDLSDVTISGYDMTVANTYTVTVSYTENEVEKTATYEIQVKPDCETLATITMGAAENGTFDLSVKGEQCAETAISTVLTATPATHYHLASVTATNGTVGTIEGNTCTISDITADAEITAVFEEDAKGTATFVAGAAEATGTAPASITKYVGETLTIPANTFALAGGYKFAGWKYNETIYQKGDEFTVAGDAEFVAQWEALPVWASTYTSNVELTATGGTSVSVDKVKVNGEDTEYTALKAGTSSATGVAKVTVPAGATALHFHAIMWKETSGTLSVKNGETEIYSAALRNNSGLTGTNLYTLAGDPTQDYYSISFSPALTEATTLTFTTTNKRFAIYGVNYVAPASVALTPASHDFGEVKEGESTEFEFTATKNIFATGDIAVSFEGDDAAAFSAGAVDAETGKFTVTFAPTEVRAYSATVKVTVDGAEATATLAGTGISATTPTISTDVETIDFGKVKQGAAVEGKTVNVELEYLDAATVAISGSVFSIDKTALDASGAIEISANTATMGAYSETLTISGEGATSKTVIVKMEVVSKYASEYTSNVTVGSDKVIINEVEYEAIKKGTGKASESATITVPKGTQTLHFHAVAWNNENTVLVVKQADTELGSFNLYKDGGVKSNSPFTLEGDNYDTDQYFNVNVAAYTAEAEAEITFTTTASPYRFVLYGVNQEGGIVPVLDHIAIEGDATKVEYEIGDQFSTAGLSVKAYYTLEGVEQDPVDVTAKADIYSDPTTFIEAGESVTVVVTAEFDDKQATKDVTVKVVEAAPEYNITISAMENGTVTASAETAKEGVEVTLTVTPATGYKLGTLTVVDAESNEVTVSNNKFTMPALDVTVSATFVEKPVAPAGAIVFAAYSKDQDATTAWTTDSELASVFSQGADLVAAITTTDKVYPGKNSLGGAKFGTGSAAGTITFTLANPVNVAKIIVSAAAYSNSDKGFTLNDKEVDMTDATTDYDTYEVAFNGAEVSEITLTSTNKRVRIEYIYIVEATVDVVREGLTPGNYGTICLENGVDAGNYTGATFYSIVKLVGEIGAPEDLILEEVDALEAGKPYIFAANDTKIEVIYNETSATAGDYNGLVGSFTEEVISTITTSENIYGVSGKFIVKAGSAARVRAHGAYIDLNQINDLSANAPAAGMRRISMKDQNAEVTTGISGVSVSADAHKLLIDGKLYIVREGKMFNANGQLIK